MNMHQWSQGQTLGAESRTVASAIGADGLALTVENDAVNVTVTPAFGSVIE